MATAASPRLERHQRMYKAATPPWKETYRKRCLERLKKNRDKFMNRLRSVKNESFSADQNVVRDVMVEEWEEFQQENQHLPRMKKHTLDLEDEEAENVDEILSIFEDVQAELMREEQLMLLEYQKNEEFDEASLCAAVANMAHETVICPICQKNHLMQNKSVIFCKCGLRIDTELDCLTLSDVQSQLDQGSTLHQKNCQESPHFSVIAEMGFQNMLMTCPVCDFMFIII